MRIAAYLVAAWFLISIVGSMLMGAGAAGGLAPLVAVGIVVWLVRSYRRGPVVRPAEAADASIAELDRSIEHRLAALEGELPPDPLASDEVVNAWSLHGREGVALERLRLTYSDIRRRYVAARDELANLRGADAEDLVLLAAYQELDSDVEEIRDYVGAVRVLADEGPELVDRAIKEHADAERAVEEARHSVAVNARTTEALIRADAKLQGAREALAKGDERPLDALRLASEARRLAESL